MLKFCNKYPSDVWVCILWYRPHCPDGGDWEKKGWWRLGQNECKIVSSADVSDVNRYWYYYAQAANGAFWAGPPHIMVPQQAFDWCVNTSSTSARSVGLRQIDVGDHDDYTVNLVP